MIKITVDFKEATGQEIEFSRNFLWLHAALIEYNLNGGKPVTVPIGALSNSNRPLSAQERKLMEEWELNQKIEAKN